VGFGYAQRGHPSRINIDSLNHCQSLCHGDGQCAHFTYDLQTRECWFLNQQEELEAEDSSVSGALTCHMPEHKPVAEETEEERSHRIHQMLEVISDQVAARSKDEVTVGLAKHLKYTASKGYLKQERYDNVVAVLNAAIEEMNSASLQRLASYGHSIPTRDDLDWLLVHIVGEQPRVEDMTGGDARNITLLPGMKSTCHDPPCAITSKSGSPAYSAGEPWANAEVKYCFDEYVAVSTRSAVDCAIGKIRSEIPGIQFTNVGYRGPDACNVQPAIFIQSSASGCWSNIGMQAPHMMEFMGLGGNQKMNLQAPGCNDCGTAIHEMLHSMGMAHEQTRPDRDNFVEIEWSNIKSNMFSQFTKNPRADTSEPYDILSIMHYGTLAFSGNGKQTIVVKDAGYHLYTDDPEKYHLYKIGQRAMMTKNDVNQLAKMYDCTSRSVCGVRPTEAPNVDDHGGDPDGPATDILQGNQGAVYWIIGSIVVVVATFALICICTSSSSKTDDDTRLLLPTEGA